MSARTERLTVAFMPIGEADWHGGQTMLGNAMRTLREVAGARVRILTVGGTTLYPYSDGVIPLGILRRFAPRRALNALAIRLTRRNLVLEHTLRAAGVDVLVGETLPWRFGTVASVSWLQDFQHRHFPQLFDRRELRRRDHVFATTMRIADRSLAMSESVRDDARALAPRYAHKLRVLQPWSIVDPMIYGRDPCDAVRKYGIPRKFFYVPNQFWIHKNHGLVVEALRIARERGQVMHVVLTGRAEDYRCPDHFHSVMAHVRKWNLSEQVHYLGVVDRVEVYDLIRQSVSVVNPSRFEGWGYAVDEAAAVGKRVLASDLAAHREQAPPACEYFDPLNAEGLARHMEDIWREAEPGPTLDLEAAARRRMPSRMQQLGNGLFGTLQELVTAPTSSHSLSMVENVSA